MEKRIILVTGATGSQGGSVAKALLDNNDFTVRILTRNAQSPKAISLQQAGAEVVEGSLEDIDTIRSAVNGCYGVFGVTEFVEDFEQEYQQGKNLVDAVKEAGIQHLVLHTSPDYNKISNGKFPTPHCDIKAALKQYAAELKIPATYLHVAFYYENFLTQFPLQKAADDSYYFGFPQGDTKLAMVSVKDIGEVVASIFNHPVEYIGRTVGTVGADESCDKYAEIMSKVLGVKVNYDYIPREEFATYEFDGAAEWANMFEVQRLYIGGRLVELIESYALNPDMQTFESWLITNKNRFKAMMKLSDATTA